MESTKIFLAGRFIETSKTLKVYYPYNGDLFATTYKAGEEHFNEAIEAAESVRLQLKKNASIQAQRDIIAYKKPSC